MFDNIEMNNFRGIESLKIENLKQLNIIVGSNNSGKTTILEALFLLTGINPTFPIYINQIRDLYFFDENIWKSYFYNLNSNNNIILKGKELSKKEYRELIISPYFSKEINNSININTNIFGINGLNLNYKIENSLLNEKSNYNTKIYLSNKTGKLQTNIKNIKNVLGIFLSSNFKTNQSIEHFNNIQIRKEKQHIINILKRIENSITDIILGTPNNTIYVDIGLNHLIPLNLVGEGFSRIFSIISAILDAKNGYIFIDEIENGLHYSILKILWKGLIETIKKSNAQVFVTTHSYECIEALSDIYESDNLNEDFFSFFRIEKNKNETIIIKSSPSVLCSVIENEWEVR